MNEQRHVQLVQLGIKGREAFVIEIPAVDVAADLGAAQIQLANRAFQLSRGHFWVLHRQVGESDETLGMPAHGRRKTVVDFLAKAEALDRVKSVKEKERRDREDLHVHGLRAHVLLSAFDAIDLLGLEAHIPVPSAVRDQAGAFLSDAQPVGTAIGSFYLTYALMWHVMRVYVYLHVRSFLPRAILFDLVASRFRIHNKIFSSRDKASPSGELVAFLRVSYPSLAELERGRRSYRRPISFGTIRQSPVIPY